MNQTIVITGASSGIGKATAKYFAQKGWRVAATMRNTEKANELKNIPNISVYQLDVNDDDLVKQAIKRIHNEFKKIDALVNNAGYGEFGVFESLSLQDYKNQFETNFFGVLRTTLEILPIMRNQKRGSIINITSYSEVVSLPMVSVYGASKCALDGFSNSLRLEVEQFGINVSVVIPGYTKTNLATPKSMKKLTEKYPKDYEELVAKAKKKLDVLPGLSESILVAQTIHKAITDKRPQSRYVAAPDAQMIVDIKHQKSDQEVEQFVKEMML